MKRKLFDAFKFLAFISIGIFLFWKVYKDQPIDELIESAQNVNYWWISLGLLIGILSHYIRALRWGIALDSMGISARKDNLFHSVMVGYLANLAIPRMGEVSRAAVLKKYNQVPFSAGFGTIVSERIIDLLFLGIATLYVLIFENDIIISFFKIIFHFLFLEALYSKLYCYKKHVQKQAKGLLSLVFVLFNLSC